LRSAGVSWDVQKRLPRNTVPVAITLLTAVPSRAVITPPTKGVHVPEEDNAASSKPNSVLDVPISRDSRLLRGPSIYVALGTKVCLGNEDKRGIEDSLMTPDAQRARTQ